AVVVPGGLAGVQAHPDTGHRTTGPVPAGQAALGLRAGCYRVRGRAEDDEDVSLGAELGAVMAAERLALQPALGRQQVTVAVTEPGQQPGRALHITEEHGDSAGGQLPPAAMDS